MCMHFKNVKFVVPSHPVFHFSPQHCFEDSPVMFSEKFEASH